MRESLTAQAGLLGELVSEVVDPTLETLGVSVSTFELLSAVRSGGGTLPQAELARRMGISPPSLCEAVQLSTHRGLIRQGPHPTDARAKVLELTPKGSRIVEQILERMNEAERIMLHGVHPQDLQVALDVLRQAIKNLAKGLTGSTQA